MHRNRLTIFVAYSRKDKDLCDEFLSHLKLLEKEEHVSIKTNEDIQAGEDFYGRIMDFINSADIILILMSADFFASEDLIKQVNKALEKKARIIPILLRYVSYPSELSKLVSFPKTKKSIGALSRAERDEAFSEITEEIRKICKNHLSHENEYLNETLEPIHVPKPRKHQIKRAQALLSSNLGKAVIVLMLAGFVFIAKNVTAGISNQKNDEVDVAHAEVEPTLLRGQITLSRANDLTDVCLKIDGFPNGLPAGYEPYFTAWAPGGDSNTSMIFSSKKPCEGGYILSRDIPSISLGGTLSIHDEVGLIEYVLVGSFLPEPGAGCADVGMVLDSVIRWRSSQSRERTADSEIHATGDYGWVCRPLKKLN